MLQAQYCRFRQTRTQIVLAIAVFIFGLDIVLLSAIYILNSANHVVWGFEYVDFRHLPAVWKSYQNLNILILFSVVRIFSFNCGVTSLSPELQYVALNPFFFFSSHCLLVFLWFFPQVSLWQFLVGNGDISIPLMLKEEMQDCWTLTLPDFTFCIIFCISSDSHFIFKHFAQICSVCPVLTPILCSCGVLGALFTIQCNICVTGHFWELALYVIFGYS